MPSLYAALWSRGSTGSSANAGRTVADSMHKLNKAMDKAVRRMGEAWVELPEVERQPRLKGVFVAPEYYFANAEMGSWDNTAGNFRSRPIEQTAKEALMADLVALSRRHPNYVIVPGSVAWRKPLDRPDSEKYKVDKDTGLRTGPEKTVARRDKVAAVIGATGANNKMGGGRYMSEPFQLAVLDAIAGLTKGTPPVPCPYDLVAYNQGFVSSGADPQQAFEAVIRAVKVSPFAEAICDWAGLPRTAVAVIPKKSEKVAAVTSGTATHLMRNTAFVLHGGKVVFKYNKRGDFHECIGDGSTVFMPGEGLGKTAPILGVTFGLEICLDHAKGILHTGVTDNTVPDVHIVMSDTVTNHTAHMKASKYFLHASTASPLTGVWAAPDWTPADRAELAGTDSADGGAISYWKLKI